MWYRNTLAESIKASMDEKGGGNMYVESATLGKSIVVDKRYKRKYDKYKYYTAAGTGSTKEYIDGKAGGKIYVEMYKHCNMPYVWYKTLAESIKASIEEKGGGNKYVEPAALGKNIVVDKRYHRTRGKTAGSIRLRIEEYECRERYRKYVKDSSETLFSVSDKMDQDGAGNNPEMVGNVPQQAASTGEYYLIEVPCYSLSTCIAMLMSVTVHAYKPYMSSILVICLILHVCPMPSYRKCVNRSNSILMMVFTYNRYECMRSNVYVSLRSISFNTLSRVYIGGNWYSRYRE